MTGPAFTVGTDAAEAEMSRRGRILMFGSPLMSAHGGPVESAQLAMRLPGGA